MIKYRLDFAKKYLDDAVKSFNQKRCNSSASRAYYASYQAMWSALGEPVDGKTWKNVEASRNNKAFCSGILVRSRSPENRPGTFGGQTPALETPLFI